MEIKKLVTENRRLWSVKQLIFILCLVFIYYLLFPSLSYPEVLERIVAIVNDEIILLSEFKEAFEKAQKTRGDISEKEVLDEMINRVLILEEAKRLLRVNTSKGSVDDNAIINEFIERRIKAFIHIPYSEIEAYYLRNRGLFADKKFYEVRDEIESIMVKERLDIKLREYIKELRNKSFIRIQATPLYFPLVRGE
jgi:hypothetical protein